MLYPRFSFISTILLVAIALSQPVLAQAESDSGINKISTVESLQRQTTIQGNAEVLGPIELDTNPERSPTPAQLPETREIRIRPEQRDLFTPRPVTPAETDATIDRGIGVIINNP
jgi:hypothetical protein